ncbi:MAG: Tol-Pal system protein TolB, partial [Undibacterium sp.]|nr:Tol-Pal system protein TolB [Undibacterium sp.]
MKIISLVKFAAKAVALVGLIATGSAHAQLRVEVSGVGSSQLPIAIAAFADEAIAPQQISAIIKDDLMRSGYFKIIEVGSAISETSQVNFGDWKSRGAEALVVGSVQKLSDGRFDVRYK